MPNTSLGARRNPALAPLVALALLAWVAGVCWLLIDQPLSCTDPETFLFECSVSGMDSTQSALYAYWTIAVGGLVAAIGFWTFLAPEGRDFRAAFILVAAVLFLAGPWLLHGSVVFFAGDKLVATLLPGFREPRVLLLTQAIGELAVLMCTPIAMAVVLFRRERWVHACAWTAVSLTCAAAVAALLY